MREAKAKSEEFFSQFRTNSTKKQREKDQSNISPGFSPSGAMKCMRKKGVLAR